MAANAKRLMELGLSTPLAKELAAQIGASLPVEDGSITNAKVSPTAAIATTKLADGDEIATLVAAVGTPAAYSADPEDIAAVLVAAGLMQAGAG